ncbi:hypothetical protein F6X40_34530 [Paraburkholderia sp. UCT31]|uniref:hypothetical protein n=1 Tax=Paraburkholderia sp. UCT31 TaxID=2615209 RepID=UPI0016551C3C|nr:hypothetical protein [Paraburkholderia sp. UCT31]MBC8741680.1 hypothetical protein [Paraburkholderia sp. UCT31]
MEYLHTLPKLLQYGVAGVAAIIVMAMAVFASYWLTRPEPGQATAPDGTEPLDTATVVTVATAVSTTTWQN